MTQGNIHVNNWQLGRVPTTSLGSCYITLNNMQDKSRYSPGQYNMDK